MSGQENAAGNGVDSQVYDQNYIPPEEAAKEVGPEAQDTHVDADASVAADAQPAAALAAAAPQWRVAKSLLKLRSQVNALAPGRDKASDGTIGNQAHCHGGAPNTSDHCAWVKDGSVGVVTAMDVTHDPNGGCDAGALAHSIVDNQDSRVKYVIWNRKIANSSPIGGQQAWAWRDYHGANPHNKHCHISVKPQKSLYDDTDDWTIEVETS